MYHGSAIAQNKKIPGSQSVLRTESPLTRGCRKYQQNDRAEERRHRPFRQHAQRHANIKRGQIDSLSLSRHAHQASIADRERSSQRHVHRSGAGIADDSRARRGDERGVDFDAAAKFSEEYIDGDYEQRGVQAPRECGPQRR